MSTIQLSLNFSGAILPVIDNEDGRPRIPFKPIVESIGADWMTQYRRVSQGQYLHRRLGICIGQFPYAGQMREMVGIRLDRVAAYLNSLNPDQIRGAGNEDSADFLEAKHQEWDNLLHQYELHGGILGGKQSSGTRNQRLHEYLSVCRELRLTKDGPARVQLLKLASELAAQLGVGHINPDPKEDQPDLFESEARNGNTGS